VYVIVLLSNLKTEEDKAQVWAVVPRGEGFNDTFTSNDHAYDRLLGQED
jgi:hypothetical protein